MAPTPNKYRLPFEKDIAEMEARLAGLEARYADARAGAGPSSGDAPGAAPGIAEQVRRLRRELIGLTRSVYANLTPWETVLVSRCDARPQTRDYIALVFDQFVELHGDRAIGDDGAVVTGFAHLGDQKVLLVGHQKGKTLAERQACNFGCAHPEGYRKALLKMRLAEKFGLPIVCLVDTPGAYPGIGAEERGQASVIAESIMAMSQIETPIVCVIIGEGGSGGALGIGVGDRVAMLEHSYYSVISPEGCATILWKGAEHAPRAAEALKFTARDLARFGIIDEVIPEPLGGAHRDHREAALNLKGYLLRALREIKDEGPRADLLARRYAKYRNLGVFLEDRGPLLNGELDAPGAVG
jgi:acetyl-CoA carboxylase carboxyl transferase subunit alpha